MYERPRSWLSRLFCRWLLPVSVNGCHLRGLIVNVWCMFLQFRNCKILDAIRQRNVRQDRLAMIVSERCCVWFVQKKTILPTTVPLLTSLVYSILLTWTFNHLFPVILLMYVFSLLLLTSRELWSISLASDYHGAGKEWILVSLRP